MTGRTISKEDLKFLAEELIERYPMVDLSEIEVGWQCVIVIQVLESGFLDTPRAIIQGSYQKVRAFETAFQMMKNARISYSSHVSAVAVTEAI
jgi:hypothetical protein